MKKLGVIQSINFAGIFEESVVDGFINIAKFFSFRDSYYEIIRNAIRHNAITKEEIIATCNQEPNIKEKDIKAYAAATAKYYLHSFGISDEDMPGWIDNTPPSPYPSPFIVNASSLNNALLTTPKEFREKNVLVCEKDFRVV